MTQATRDNQDTGSAGQAGELDASVGELIDQLAPDRDGPDATVDLTPAPFGQPIADIAAEPTNDPASEEDLLRSVQALLREVPGAAPEKEAPVEPVVPVVSDAPADLQLPDDLFDAKPEETPPEPEPDPEAATKLESLDHELAGLADRLISDEIADEPEPPPDDAPTLAAAIAVSAAPQPTPAPVSERPVRHAPEPEQQRSPFEVIPEPGPEPKPLRQRSGVFVHAMRPLLAVCAAASAPLRNKPQHVRDRIGWHALWLGFLGLCVWTYVLFIRSPEAPIPTLAPAKQASVEHAASKGSSKKDDHGSGKKPAPKKQASAGKH